MWLIDFVFSSPSEDSRVFCYSLGLSPLLGYPELASCRPVYFLKSRFPPFPSVSLDTPIYFFSFFLPSLLYSFIKHLGKPGRCAKISDSPVIRETHDLFFCVDSSFLLGSCRSVTLAFTYRYSLQSLGLQRYHLLY